MGLLSYKIKNTIFTLVIDVTVFNVVTSDIQNKKGKVVSGVMAKKREEHKTNKYQEACA